MRWLTQGPTKAEKRGTLSKRMFSRDLIGPVPPHLAASERALRDLETHFDSMAGQVFPIEAVLGARHVAGDRNGPIEYLVKWRGYLAIDSSWVPEYVLHMFFGRCLLMLREGQM